MEINEDGDSLLLSLRVYTKGGAAVVRRNLFFEIDSPVTRPLSPVMRRELVVCKHVLIVYVLVPSESLLAGVIPTGPQADPCCVVDSR